MTSVRPLTPIVQEFEVKGQNGEEKTLFFAAAYGFRNVQKILRQLKFGTCKYQYVEIMSCPAGCNNGGGQVKMTSKDEGDRKTQERALPASL